MTFRTEHASDLGVAETQVFPGTGDTHIAETTLFLETATGFRDAALVWKQAVFHAHDKNHRKLQTLGRVQCHQLHTVIPGLTLGFTGLQ